MMFFSVEPTTFMDGKDVEAGCILGISDLERLEVIDCDDVESIKGQ